MKIFLVGGAVRDKLLGLPIKAVTISPCFCTLKLKKNTHSPVPNAKLLLVTQASFSMPTKQLLSNKTSRAATLPLTP